MFHLTLLIFGAFLSNFYNSKLISNHIVEWDKDPISNLIDLASSSTYYPVIAHNTSIESIMLHSDNEDFLSIKQKVNKNKKKHFSQVKGDAYQIKNDGEVYIDTELALVTMQKTDPTIRLLPDRFMVSGLYFVWQKDFYLEPIFSKTIMLMQETGRIEKYYVKHFREKSSSGTKQHPATLTFSKICAPFAIYSLSILISLICHLFSMKNKINRHFLSR